MVTLGSRIKIIPERDLALMYVYRNKRKNNLSKWLGQQTIFRHNKFR